MKIKKHAAELSIKFFQVSGFVSVGLSEIASYYIDNGHYMAASVSYCFMFFSGSVALTSFARALRCIEELKQTRSPKQKKPAF